MMDSPAACRAVAVWCRTAAHNSRRGGYEHDAAAYDGSALGFAFRAAELEYDARGGMTLRKALARAASSSERGAYSQPHAGVSFVLDEADVWDQSSSPK